MASHFCRHAGRGGASSGPGQVDGRERMFSGSEFFPVFTGLGSAKPALPCGSPTLPILCRVLKRFRPREIYNKLICEQEEAGESQTMALHSPAFNFQGPFSESRVGCCPHLKCSTSHLRRILPSDCFSCSHVFQNQ